MKTETNRPVTVLFAELQKLGAGEFKHLNGSLEDHLQGTAALLREWGANDVLVNAGLYHAVYGTEGYEPSLTSLELRNEISELIGQQAEEIVYLYCACDRKEFWPRIGTEQQNKFTDRFRQQNYLITEDQLMNFCELTLANELEIFMHGHEFSLQNGGELLDLFMRMDGLVSQPGFRAYKAVLKNLERLG